jgi:hypothetical protein
VCSLSRYNGLNSLESLRAEVKTAGCLPHKTALEPATDQNLSEIAQRLQAT